jgi:hypothetical protein
VHTRLGSFLPPAPTPLVTILQRNMVIETIKTIMFDISFLNIVDMLKDTFLKIYPIKKYVFERTFTYLNDIIFGLKTYL